MPGRETPPPVCGALVTSRNKDWRRACCSQSEPARAYSSIEILDVILYRICMLQPLMRRAICAPSPSNASPTQRPPVSMPQLDAHSLAVPRVSCASRYCVTRRNLAIPGAWVNLKDLLTCDLRADSKIRAENASYSVLAKCSIRYGILY